MSYVIEIFTCFATFGKWIALFLKLYVHTVINFRKLSSLLLTAKRKEFLQFNFTEISGYTKVNFMYVDNFEIFKSNQSLKVINIPVLSI